MSTRDEVQLKVGVHEQGFGATLTIVAQEDGVGLVTVEQCEEALREAGVVFGIQRDALESLVEQGPGEPVKVARGIPPRPGTDATIELFFVSEKQVKPREREDGTVDYHELGLVENVPGGELLAQKHPATPGGQGMTVLGEEVQGAHGKDIPFRPGTNAALSEDGLQITSQGPGHPVLEQNNCISVHPVYRVNGDVDFGVGNIEFVGTVEIAGGVAPGFTVKAQGDVQMGSSSSAERLIAGQDVVVSGGIQGLKRGSVAAGRDVRARFVENAQVTSERNVYAGSILHSQVECRKRVEVITGKGLIAGGTIRAGEAVVAKTIGTPLATPTEIQVGTDPVVRKEMAKAVAEAKQCQKQIVQLEAREESLTSLMAFKSGDSKQGETVRLKRRLRLLREHLAELEATADGLARIMENSDRGLVKADMVYPGVRIHVGLSTMFVDETRRDLRLQPGSNELVREE